MNMNSKPPSYQDTMQPPVHPSTSSPSPPSYPSIVYPNQFVNVELGTTVEPGCYVHPPVAINAQQNFVSQPSPRAKCCGLVICVLLIFIFLGGAIFILFGAVRTFRLHRAVYKSLKFYTHNQF